MRIGIIGAGMIGGTLARRLVALGHEVALANSRGPETLRELAAEIGAKAVSASEAARSGDIVIVTIPERAVMDLPKDLFAGVPNDVVVIDTGNYYPARDGRIAAIADGQVERDRQVSALARELYHDRSPPPPPKDELFPMRDAGAGRPTKRDRRAVRRIRGRL